MLFPFNTVKLLLGHVHSIRVECFASPNMYTVPGKIASPHLVLAAHVPGGQSMVSRGPPSECPRL